MSGTVYFNTDQTHVKGFIYWEERNINNANNTSDVYVEMRMYRDNTGYTTYGTGDFYMTVNGTGVNHTGESFSITYNSNTLVDSGTVTVPHNSDGSKTITIAYDGSANPAFTIPGSSFSATLTTIPRGSTVSSSISWTAGTQNLPISLSTYSSSYHHSIQIFVGDTESPVVYGNNIGQRDNIGSSYTWVFTEAEIQAIYNKNNMYENRPVIVRVFTYDSGGNQIGGYNDATGTVYAVPTGTVTLGTSGTFNIGTSIPYTINNFTSALGGVGSFNYDLTMTFGGFTKTWSGVTAKSGNLTLTSTEVQSMYNQIPNANSGIGSMVTRTKYDTILTEDGAPTSHTTNFTANVTGSNPTFGHTYGYEDINSTTLGITGNSQYIIQGKSTVQVDFHNTDVATPLNGASMSYYLATIDSHSLRKDVPGLGPTLSLAANAGSTVAAVTHYVQFTWVSASGESLPSPEATITVTSGQNLVVTLPTFPSGVTSANIYMSTSSGAEKLQGSTSSTTYTRSTVISTSGVTCPTVMKFSMSTVNSSSNTSLKIQAVDSRGNSTTTSTTLTIIPYTAPVVSTTSGRNNGFDANTLITLSGSYSLLTVNGTSMNTLQTVQYQYKKSTDASYNTATSFTYTTSSGTYSATSVTVSLDNAYMWNVKVTVTDKLGSTTITNTVTAGVPIVFIDATMKNMGIGKFPATGYFLDVAGKINMNNNNIDNVNQLTFNDPGGTEGIKWLGGNLWQVYESPNDLSNASGNLQFVSGSTPTRRMTLDTSGNLDVTSLITANGGRSVPSALGGETRLEIVTMNVLSNGGGTTITGSTTFPTAFTTIPNVMFAMITTTVGYVDVILEPFISSVTTTGFSCKFTCSQLNGTQNTFGAGTMVCNFLVFGK